jgi:hypothetical protein
MPMCKEIKENVKVCYKCGNKYYEDKNYTDYISNIHPILIKFLNYGCDIEDDEWSFDVCSKCLKEWIDTFEIKPEGYNASDPYKAYAEALNSKNIKYKANMISKEDYILMGLPNEDGSWDFESQ